MPTELIARCIAIVPIGILSGMLSGAFGIGGGIIAVPLIRHTLAVSAHIAIGTTLAVILPTAVIGAMNYLKEGKLNIPFAAICGAPAALGTIGGSALSHYIDGKYLMLGLAGLMTVVGFDFVTGLGNKLKAKAPSEEGNIVIDGKVLLTTIVIGLFVGLLSGMLGVGGGFIMVPAFCYLLHLPLKVAFGTSLVVISIVALPGTVVHWYHNHVDLSIAWPMLLGSIPGAWLGSRFSLKLKDQVLRSVFGTLLIIMALIFASKELL